MYLIIYGCAENDLVWYHVLVWENSILHKSILKNSAPLLFLIYLTYILKYLKPDFGTQAISD